MHLDGFKSTYVFLRFLKIAIWLEKVERPAELVSEVIHHLQQDVALSTINPSQLTSENATKNDSDRTSLP